MAARGVQPGYAAADGMTVTERGGRTGGRPVGDGTAPASRREAALAILERAAAGTSSHGKTFVEGPCVHCGTRTTWQWSPGNTPIRDRRLIYSCSPECARELRRKSQTRGRHKRRARMVDAFVEHVDVVEVAEACDWLCGICGQWIDRNLVWPNVGSLTLDHIRPLARGGLHDRSNVQPAHFFCNSSKRDRDFASSVFRGVEGKGLAL